MNSSIISLVPQTLVGASLETDSFRRLGNVDKNWGSGSCRSLGFYLKVPHIPYMSSLKNLSMSSANVTFGE